MAKIIYRLLLTMLLLFIVTAGHAQNADSHFQKGLKWKQTETVAAQEAAIKMFTLAKIAYNTREKKQQCEVQIAECKKTLEKLKASPVQHSGATSARRNRPANNSNVTYQPDNDYTNPGNRVKLPENGKSEYADSISQAAVVTEPEAPELTITSSRTAVDFPYHPKGVSRQVTVTSNGEWEVYSKPKWVKTERKGDMLDVKAEVNATDSNRSGVIMLRTKDNNWDVISSDDYMTDFEVELLSYHYEFVCIAVNQAKEKKFHKFWRKLGNQISDMFH